jgi:hypothetical protein
LNFRKSNSELPPLKAVQGVDVKAIEKRLARIEQQPGGVDWQNLPMILEHDETDPAGRVGRIQDAGRSRRPLLAGASMQDQLLPQAGRSKRGLGAADGRGTGSRFTFSWIGGRNEQNDTGTIGQAGTGQARFSTVLSG